MVRSSGPSGVLATHDSHFADDTDAPYYAWTPLLASGLNKDPWSEQPLSVTGLVGIPMRFMEFSMTDSDGPSETIALLSLDCDPKSDTFGDALQQSSMDVLLARAGSEDLQGLHVKALVAFVKIELGDLVTFGKLVNEDEIGEMRPKAELAAAKATRAEFEVFYKSYYSDMVATNDKLKGVGSPFNATPYYHDMPRCVCGFHRGSDGVALLLCGQCKKARYCSRSCQKKDWKAHKMVCGKDE